MTNPIDSETTIISVICIDGILIATDSKSNLGSFVSCRNFDKVFQLSKFVVCCGIGNSADNQHLFHKLKNYVLLNGYNCDNCVLVREIVQYIKNLLYTYSLECTIICAGWDNLNGFQNYLVTIGGCILQKHIFLCGMGSKYISGLIDKDFKTTMDVKKCQDLFVKTLSIANNKYSKTGGIIRLTIISNNGVTKKSYLPY
mmetsp:Transcript_20712/g.46879  ORF Transcript_20712/g.46879 Transcript_20712/m.46879 type:complete len:199 (+) Transcript_20712:280-876(+)